MSDLSRKLPDTDDARGIGCRILPLKRVREHTSIVSNWVPIINEILTARLSAIEINVLLTIILLRPKQHLSRRELRVLVGRSYGAMSAALDSLVRRRILFFDLVTYPGGEKEIWHISNPYYWKIDGFSKASYAPGSVDPDAWEPRRLMAAPEEGRIDEYSSAATSAEYGKAPRILINLDLSANARRVWLYLASLRQTWHPTSAEIARAVQLSKPTVLRCLDTLQEVGMIVAKDYHHPRFLTRLERTYHTVHPAFWRFENCSSLPSPASSILQNNEMIEYYSEGKKWKQGASTSTLTGPEGKKWKRQTVKNGNTRGPNPETQSVKNGNADGQIRKHRESNSETGGCGGSRSGQGLRDDFGACDNIPGENIPRENVPGEEESPSPVACDRWIYNSEGNPSRHITSLVADHVEYAFQDKHGKVYPYRLNLWIADFAERAAASLASVDRAFDETQAFCEFVSRRFSGQHFHVRQGSFQHMEAAWLLHKSGAHSDGAPPKAQFIEAEVETQNQAPESKALAQPAWSTETVLKSPETEILPSVPTGPEGRPDASVSGTQSPPIGMPIPSEGIPRDRLPSDPERQQWLVARVYGKARKSQRSELNALWARKPGSILPMLCFFSKMNYANEVLVDAARVELDALGILRKSDIPPLPWGDSGGLVPAAPAPIKSAGDGTLPLYRDRLKRVLRKLNQEPNLQRRFEIEDWLLAISDDGELYANMCNKFGTENVNGVLNGNE